MKIKLDADYVTTVIFFMIMDDHQVMQWGRWKEKLTRVLHGVVSRTLKNLVSIIFWTNKTVIQPSTKIQSN